MDDQQLLKRPALSIAMMYVVSAALWILLSDWLVFQFSFDAQQSTVLSWIKGFGFVAITGGILYYYMARAFDLRDQLQFRLSAHVKELESAQDAQNHLQNQLRESSELLESIFNHIPVMLASMDTQGHLSLMNKEWKEVLGWNAQEVENHPDILSELYPDPTEREIVRNHIMKADGSWRDFSTSTRHHGVRQTRWANIRLSDGRSVGIGLDITEMQESRAELQRVNQFLQTLIQAAPVGIATFDAHRNITLWNPAMEQLSGWKAEEVVGRPSVVDPANAEEVARLRARVESGEILKGVETKRKHKDGREIAISISAGPLYNEKKEVIGEVRIVKDISERIKMEAALRESELRFRQIADNIREMFFLLDAKTREILYISPAYETMWGRSVDSVYLDRRSATAAVHKDDLDRVMAATEEQKKGLVTDVTYRVVQPDKSVRWVRARTLPVFNDDGELIRNAGVAEDITDQVRYENQLKRLSRRLVTLLDEERGRLARELHDQIGQQLTGLGLNLGTLRMHMPEEHPLKSAVDDSNELVSSIIERLRTVISDLRPPVLDDMGLLAGLQWYAEKLRRRSTVEVEIAASDVPERLTPRVNNTMYQIAQEALTNAIKHAEATHIWVTLAANADYLTMTVRDDGKGFNAQKATEEDFSGSWGLHIMQERARTVMGAHLSIVSTPGIGTEITMEVPM